MDLVFNRYQSPFFLNMTIENSDLSEFIDMLLKKRDDEMLWEMYLSTSVFNEKSFEDWKKDILGSSQEDKQSKEISQNEKQRIFEKSENILREFKPPERGENYA